MGKNTGQNRRLGPVKNRSQCYNGQTGQYIKRDVSTGRFMSAQTKPHKGVLKEQTAKQQVAKQVAKQQPKKKR